MNIWGGVMFRAAVLLGLVLVSNLALAFSYTVEIPEQEIQEKLAAKMPLKAKKLLAKVILSNPAVDLIKDSNRIGVAADFEARLPGIKGKGRVNIIGDLSYNPDKGEFYLHKPEIASLTLDKLPDQYDEDIRRVLQPLAAKALEAHPVYKLKDDDLRQKLAKAVLQSVSVKNEKLVVVLSAF